MSKIKYFDVKPFIKKYTKLKLLFFVGRKGIGKTYSAVKWLFEEYEQHNKGFAWLFITKDEAKDFLPEFKSYINHDRYEVKGLNVIDKERQMIIGKLGGANTPNMFKNNQIIKNLVFDEVTNNSPMSYSKLYENFIIITSNMERTKRDFKSVMFMNAFTQDNIFFQKWGIVKGADNKIIKGRIGVFFLSKDSYLGDADDFTLAKELATYEPKMYEMVYENKFSFDDNNYIKSDLDLITYKWKIIYNGETFLCGSDISGKLAFTYYNGEYTNSRVVTIENKDALFTRVLNDKDVLNDIIDIWINAMLKDKILFKDFYIRGLFIEIIDSVKMTRDLGGM